MIILGITGSIAAYKSIELAKLLIENGFDVRIVLTAQAENFVSLLTLRSLFPKKIYVYKEQLSSEDEMLHITLAKQARIILIAPASANIIAKLAHGYADCLLTNLILASNAKVYVAPAMNKVMWENPLVQRNIHMLRHMQILGPVTGTQACGDDGAGRMLEPIDIVEYIKNSDLPQILKGKKILITAGPTIERIDPVRYISNFSSGKMGYAIAKIAVLIGAEVTLVSGLTALKAFPGVKIISVEAADEMLKASMIHAGNKDIFIANAAVSDYKPKKYFSQKLKKDDLQSNLLLEKNEDIVSFIKQNYPGVFVVGFAAETHNFKKFGEEKLLKKQIDMIAINDVSAGKIFNMDDNELHVISKSSNKYFIEKSNKENVAHSLLKIILAEMNMLSVIQRI